ncbi:MAG: hypothetical protein NC420_05610 [Eubacterium sp.]|nr:hypothetical protein [Eubacterium sp.]
MKGRIKKIFDWGPDRRTVAILAVCALALLLAPLLRLAFYAVPWYDDYNYGLYARDALAAERSVRSAVLGAAECTRISWYAWQGTFSSIFFMSLMPAAWGEQYYFVGSIFLILMLTCSVWTLTGVLARHVLKSGRADSIVLQAVFTSVVVELIYSAQQGFYWYNGGVHYVGMHSFLLFLVAAWVRLMAGCGRAASAFLLAGSLAGAVLAGGANYVTALQGLLAGASIVALGALLRRRRALLLIPSLLVYGLCFYQSASAPGNDVRWNVLGGGMRPVTAIVYSFRDAVLHLGEFTGPAMPIMLALALPFIRNVVRKQPLRFRYPGLVLAWSFCLYAAGFTPTLYAMGHDGFARTLNAVKITYQLLFFLNAVYWTGWICRKRQEAQSPWAFEHVWDRLKRILGIGQEDNPFRFYLLIGALILTVFTLEKNQAGHYSSYGAYYYIHTGEANEFHKEYLARVETIKRSGPVVEVDAYYFRPWFLRLGDLSENAGSEENQAMADWYHKEAIYCGSAGI